MVNNNAPGYLCELVPKVVAPVRNLRNSVNIPLPKCCTELFKSYFYLLQLLYGVIYQLKIKTLNSWTRHKKQNKLLYYGERSLNIKHTE